MKTRICIFFLLLSTGFYYSGCNSAGDCFHGTGSVITEDRNLAAITNIYLTGNIDLIVHKDSNRRMRVKAGENLIDGIETKVESGTLRISNTNKCNWVRHLDPELVVEIWTDTLEGILVEDATGNMEFSDTLSTTIFRLDIFNSYGSYNIKTNTETLTLAIHNGAADIKAEGTSINQYIYHVGYGEINALGVSSENVYINNRGTNDIFIRTKNLLDAKIEYTGNIYYNGNPGTINQQITGTGKLIKL